MTDNEIIKTYEDKVNLIGSMTSVYLDEEDGFDLYTVMSNVLDLINRQKAEIDELSEKLNATIAGQETLQEYIAQRSPLGMVGDTE